MALSIVKCKQKAITGPEGGLHHILKTPSVPSACDSRDDLLSGPLWLFLHCALTLLHFFPPLILASWRPGAMPSKPQFWLFAPSSARIRTWTNRRTEERSGKETARGRISRAPLMRHVLEGAWEKKNCKLTWGVGEWESGKVEKEERWDKDGNHLNFWGTWWYWAKKYQVVVEWLKLKAEEGSPWVIPAVGGRHSEISVSVPFCLCCFVSLNYAFSVTLCVCIISSLSASIFL